MKKAYLYLILVTVVISLTVFSSCRFGCVKGSGKQITENRKVTDFTRLEIDGSFKVILKQDSSLSVTINADDNFMKYIHSSNDGDKLKIYSKKSFCGSGEVIITIGVKNLQKIATAGSIDLSTNGMLTTKDLALELNGPSKITMDLNAANVTTSGNGVIEMNLKGQASSHKIELAGVAKIEALDFVVGSYDIETTGTINSQINVLKELNVQTTGAADIKYRGNPSSVNTSKTGAATVTKIN